MLAVRTYAANPGFPLRLGIHDFYKTAAGELAHDIDGDRRATVPPEGWEVYAVEWPDCAPVVAGLRLAAAGAAGDAPGGSGTSGDAPGALL